MKKFKFVSFKDKAGGEFVLEIDNIPLLYDYHKKYYGNLVKEYFDEFSEMKPEDIRNWEKWKSSFARSIAAVAPIFGSMMAAADHLEREGLNNKLRDIKEQGKIYCADNYCYFTTEDEPIVVLEKSEMLYPQYGVEDIRIIKWAKNGDHYYAKIGKYVVIDGVQKWDNHDEAYECALKFFKEIEDYE